MRIGPAALTNLARNLSIMGHFVGKDLKICIANRATSSVSDDALLG